MRVSFAFPSSGGLAGGIVALYEFANGLARRGHDVRFLHGPAWPTRVDRVDELPEICFRDGVCNLVIDAFDDSDVPDGDIVFAPGTPDRLGLQVNIVQGYRMLSDEWERDTFLARVPKVCIARWLVDVGRGLGVPDEQLLHVPYGIDHDVFAVRTPLEGREYDVAMLYHPHREKGWDVAARALDVVRRRIPGLRAVVFGRDEPPALPDGVVYRRALDHRGLADEVYNATRVFVQPSYHEGFGFTPVEAMACGAALVTTDNGGSRDYALPGETAWVVPPGDAEGLADGIEAILRDDAGRIALAEAGSRYVRRFDWDLSAALLEGHLESYLADPERYRRPPSSDAHAGV